MRVAVGLILTALTFLAAAGVGVFGGWAAAAGAILLTVGAITCAVALEDADFHTRVIR